MKHSPAARSCLQFASLKGLGFRSSSVSEAFWLSSMSCDSDTLSVCLPMRWCSDLQVALRRNFIVHAGCPVSAENMVAPSHGTERGKPFESGIA
jgi:hypothetical protein